MQQWPGGLLLLSRKREAFEAQKAGLRGKNSHVLGRGGVIWHLLSSLDPFGSSIHETIPIRDLERPQHHPEHSFHYALYMFPRRSERRTLGDRQSESLHQCVHELYSNIKVLPTSTIKAVGPEKRPHHLIQDMYSYIKNKKSVSDNYMLSKSSHSTPAVQNVLWADSSKLSEFS